MLAAAAVAGGIYLANAATGDSPERAVMTVAAMFALLLPLPACVYLLARRRAAAPDTLGLTVLLGVVVLLLAVDLYWAAKYIFFPADILIWSESEFVNDIIKLRVGHPIYTPEVNNESFIYLPGAQFLTYLLASLVGQAASIPTYRLIQFGYTLGAVVAATAAARTLLLIGEPGRDVRNARLWSAIWVPFFFLVATNLLTNPYTLNLHNDALAQLISIVAFWLLLLYVKNRSPRVLAAMALIPAVGFVVKQNLLIWGLLYLLYLVFFDRPRSLRRIATFGAVSAVCAGAAFGGAYLLWGEPFLYWTVEVLDKRGRQISLLRSFQHVLDVWSYFAIGIVGGLVLLRGRRLPMLIGPFIVWLVFICAAAYTTGVAWMHHHMGPGCLIASVWFAAAAARLWSDHMALSERAPRAERWLRPVAWVLCGLLLMGGLGTVRIPLPPIPVDTHRYVAQIETEFEGIPIDRVLLDAGSWLYLQSGVVMKDRSTNIWDRGMAQNGDFSGILRRIQEQAYERILVRDIHASDFWYDNEIWPASTGIREALRTHYREVRIIPAVHDPVAQEPIRYLFREISVLEPRTPQDVVSTLPPQSATPQ